MAQSEAAGVADRDWRRPKLVALVAGHHSAVRQYFCVFESYVPPFKYYGGTRPGRDYGPS